MRTAGGPGPALGQPEHVSVGSLTRKQPRVSRRRDSEWTAACGGGTEPDDYKSPRGPRRGNNGSQSPGRVPRPGGLQSAANRPNSNAVWNVRQCGTTGCGPGKKKNDV